MESLSPRRKFAVESGYGLQLTAYGFFEEASGNTKR